MFVHHFTFSYSPDHVIRPASSFKILGLPILLYTNWAVLAPHRDNPFRRLLWVSNRLPNSSEGFPTYAKSYWVSTHAFCASLIVNIPSFIRT